MGVPLLPLELIDLMAKIIEPEPTADPAFFTWTFRCKHCKAKIESDLTDLRFGNFGNAMDPIDDPDDDHYYVDCPNCDRANFTPERKMSARVKEIAIENTKVERAARDAERLAKIHSEREDLERRMRGN